MKMIQWLMVICMITIGCGEEPKVNGDACAGAAGQKDSKCQLLLPDNEPMAGAAKADYSCLTKVVQPVQPTAALVIIGKTKQRLSTGADEPKGNVKVEVWTEQTKLSSSAPVATTTSDANADFVIEIPATAWTNATSKGPRVAWRIFAPDTVPTVEYNDLLYAKVSELTTDTKYPGKQVLKGAERITVSRSTVQTIEALLGVTVSSQKGIVLGVVRDCKRQEVANASAGIVDSTGKVLAGAELFYFKNKFPTTRGDQSFTSADGYFTLINAAVSSGADVRVVGNVGGKKTVLSRALIPVAKDTLVIADFDPLPEPL